MSVDTGAATRETGKTAKRQSAKPAGSAKRGAAETARVQLHFDKETIRRLGVHCSLKDSNWSAEVERVLLRFLVKEGRGRELFKTPDDVESAALAE